MNNTAQREQMSIVIAGHVDHGKSTVMGRLLADTGSLPMGKLDQVRALCERNSKPFEYAFLLDALKDEMSQGITIDAARVFFKTAQRDYLILDAPGHIEFLKNMITGASRAEAALLVIDAEEGVRENSRRHGYMLSLLGVRQLAVVVNKMDLVEYSESAFNAIAENYTAFLKEVGVEARFIIPASGRFGDNIAQPGGNMAWYTGPTVLEALDRFEKEPPALDQPLRLPVQDVYKFTKAGDKRRLVVGTVDSGIVEVGDELVFFPSGKRSRVASIEAFNRPSLTRAGAGEATALTLDEQIYVTRGELACRASEPAPKVATRVRASLFWMGREPLQVGREYLLKMGGARTPVWVEKILRVIDASDLSVSQESDRVERHAVAECILRTRRAVAFDPAEDNARTSRFVIVDQYEIRGGGILREALEDEYEAVRSHVLLRNMKWETSRISRERRAEKYNQRPTLILVTGERNTGKKTFAKALESRLFEEGKVVYFLGIGNVLYGVDADIKVAGQGGDRGEHLRRLAEVAHLLLDAGVLLVVTAVNLKRVELDLIETTVGEDRMVVVWMGGEAPSDVACDLRLDNTHPLDDQVDKMKAVLQEKNIIFKPF
ncbi:MAG TPA: GTP-binding protein [Candidatus Sumerlaeota bacterium]|nr:GTP-binding protein [Candidatus Sumerlaeota bacterium]